MASAEQVVVEIIADDSKYGPALNRAASTTRAAASDIEGSARRVGFATRNLGFQLSDIGTQLSSGQSPFIIIGQQAPQVVQALEDIKAAGGSLGQTLTAIALPGFIAVASIALTLAENLYKGADAAKTKKVAVDALAEAEKRLAGAAADANHATEQGIIDDINATKALRAREIQTRKQIQAELELAKSRLSAAQVTAKYNPGPEIPGRGVSSQAADVADLTKKIAEQNSKIAEANKSIRTGHAELVIRSIAAATDKATAATQKYENEVDRLSRLFESGKLSKDAFQAQVLSATQARDATLKAISDTRRAQSAASREAIADAKREAAERAKLARELKENNLAGELARENEHLARGREDPDGAAGFKDVMREITDERKGRLSEMSEAVHEQFLQQQDDIRHLSGLYYDLFSGGTKDLWRDFKQEGLRALALLAAQKTFALIAGFGSAHSGDGGILGALAQAAGSLAKSSPGRASGGYVNGGQMYRVNEGSAPGRVEGFVPQGSGKIIPLGQMNAAQSGPGGGASGKDEHRIIIEPNEMFDTHVDSRVVGGIVQFAPVIIEGAKSATFAAANRPGLPRSAG